MGNVKERIVEPLAGRKEGGSAGFGGMTELIAKPRERVRELPSARARGSGNKLMSENVCLLENPIDTFLRCG